MILNLTAIHVLVLQSYNFNPKDMGLWIFMDVKWYVFSLNSPLRSPQNDADMSLQENEQECSLLIFRIEDALNVLTAALLFSLLSSEKADKFTVFSGVKKNPCLDETVAEQQQITEWNLTWLTIFV